MPVTWRSVRALHIGAVVLICAFSGLAAADAEPDTFFLHDPDGAPIAGVSISLVGRTGAVVTAADGSFRLAPEPIIANGAGSDLDDRGRAWGFSVERPGGVAPLRVSSAMPGLHNVRNALAAVAVASEEQIPDTAIYAGLQEFAGVDRRFEVTENRRVGDKVVHLVDDYGHHPTEVRAVSETARALEREGVRVERLPVTAEGVLDLAHLEETLDGEVRLLSCMAVNNELGTRQPLAEIGRLLKARAPRAVFHVDAVQAFTKAPLPWREAAIDLLTLSGHKIHAPKGVGALVRCSPVPLEPWLLGGGQEGGLRSGTENPFAVVAMGEAAAGSTARHREQRGEREACFRGWLEFLAEFPRLKVFRSPAATPFIINFSNPPIPGEVTLHHLAEQGLLVSTGSACSTRKPEPSVVLLAVGMSEQEALSSIRLSFSHSNTLAGQPEVFAAFRRALDKLERF